MGKIDISLKGRVKTTAAAAVACPVVYSGES